MIYFDAIVNLMHDILKTPAPSPIGALFTSMPENRIIFRKKLSQKFSNALFRELERYYGIKFLQTGEIYLSQSLRKQFEDFYLRLFQIGMTMLSRHRDSSS